MNALHPEISRTPRRHQGKGPEARRQQMMDHFEWSPITIPQARHQQGQTFNLALAILASAYKVEL